MSFEFCDGFDDRSVTVVSGKWSASANATIATTQARTGANGIAFGTSASMTYTLRNPHATVGIGFGYYSGVLPTSLSTLVTFFGDSTSTTHITLGVDSNGAITAARGALAVGLGTSANGVWTLNGWNFWEVKATLNDTTGSVLVRKNGVTVLNVTGADTKNAGTGTTLTAMRIHAVTNNTQYVDDVYCVNGDATAPNDLLGDSKVETLLPNAEGTTTDWSLSTGTTHYTLVDENPANTTDYVFSDVDGEVELVGVADLSTTAFNVHAVQVGMYAAKSDAGARSLRRVVRSGGANYTGSDIALGTSYGYIYEGLVLDPATGSAWTPTNVNALQIGAEVRP
jgi:hypothetical protein